MEITKCPSLRELSDYLLGSISIDLVEEVETHIGECTECQAALSNCDHSGDEIIARIQQRMLSEEFEAEPELHEALRSVVNLANLARFQVERQKLGTDFSQRSDSPSPEEPLQLGQYRLLRMVGQGGMGAVYLAEHTRLGMTVALKLLSSRRTEDPQAIARFDREMKAVGRLSHANIVRATDAGEHQGRPYLAMEFVDGEDCQSIIRRGQPLRISDACEIARHAALGLQFAHEHRLIHRDMKPSNLMVSRTEEVKILDLGLARLMSESDSPGLTSDSQVMGTADYIAPEQVIAADVDLRADIYSLGCTLYALLCGEPPFAALHTAFQKLKAHEQEHAIPVHQHRTDVPTVLSQAVEKAMAKKATERFQSAAEFAAALEPFVSNANLALVAAASNDMLHCGDTAPYDEYTTRLFHEPPGSPRVTENPQNSRRPFWPILFVALGFVAMVVVAMIVLQFNSAHGSILVEIAGNEINASFSGEELLIEDRKSGNEYRLTLHGSAAEQELKAGEYSIRVVNEASGLRLNTNRFQIVRDQQVVVNATVVRPVAAVEPSEANAPLATQVPGLNSLDLRVAHWALGRRAIVGITNGELFYEVNSASRLPLQQFWIHRIDFQFPIEFTDAELDNLRKLPRLGELGFQDLVLTDHLVEGLIKFPQLQQLELRCEHFPTTGLERLAGLRSLCELRLKGAAVINRQASEAAQLPQIYSLGIEGPQITDQALIAAGSMKKLAVLSLHHSSISDEGLKHLAHLENLELLFLAYTSVTDASVKNLVGHKKLKWLNLTNTKITDAGLQQLSQLHELDRLTLMGLTLTDTGLAALQEMSQLRTLQFEFSNLSDANLEGLAALTQVTHMQLGECLTGEAVRELRRRLPTCRIDSTRTP